MHAVGNREEVSGTGSVPQIKDGSTALVHLLVGKFDVFSRLWKRAPFLFDVGNQRYRQITIKNLYQSARMRFR